MPASIVGVLQQCRCFDLFDCVSQSWDHLIEHAKSGECKDFIEYTKKANIAWFKKPLCIVA